MHMKPLLKLVLLTGLFAGASAYASPCGESQGYKRLDEQRVFTRVEKSCPIQKDGAHAESSGGETEEDEEVSWMNWAFDGQGLPNFHFINLLELLGIH